MALQAKTVFATEVELLDVSMTGACIVAEKRLKQAINIFSGFRAKEQRLPSEEL